MPPRRWQWQGPLFAAWSLALIGALLGAPLLAGAAQASTQPQVALGVSSLYRVSVAPDSWVPVVVSVTNRGTADIQGQLLVTSRVPQLSGGVPYCFNPRAATVCVYPGFRHLGFAYGGFGFGFGSAYSDTTPTSAVTYQASLDLAPATTKHMEFDVLAAAQPSNVTAKAVSAAGQVLARATGQVQVGNNATAPSLLVVTNQPGVLSSLSWPVPGGPQPQVQLLAPSELPSASAALGEFAAIVIDEADTSVLTPAEGQALESYVYEGGTLIVAGGLSWASDVAGLPHGLLPAHEVGTKALRLGQLSRLIGTQPPEQAADINRLALSRGAGAVLSEGSTPLVVEAPRGSGHVVLSAFDPAAAPLAGWAGDPALDSRLTAPAYQASDAGANQVVFAGSGFGLTVAGATPSLLDATAGAVGPQQAANALTPFLFQMPGASLPKPELFGLLLLGYVVLAGPVCFVVLRKLRRRELAWAVVPCLATVAVVLAYTTGAGIGRGRLSDEVEVARLVPGGHLAQVTSLGAVYLPRGGSAKISLPAPGPVSDLGAGAGAKLTVVQGTSLGAGAVSVAGPSDTLGGWAASRDVVVPGSMSANFGQSGATVSGNITNHLGVSLEDVAIFSATGQQRQFGSLPRGATLSFSFSVPSFSTGSGQGPAVVPVFLVNGSQGHSHGTPREQAAEQGLSELANEYSEAVGGWPVLVGLADRPFLSPGHPSRAVSLTTDDAVVLPLVPAEDAGTRLTGLAPELVGSTGLTGAVVLGPAGGTLTLAKGGALEFQFSLPSGRWDRLELDLGSPSGSGPGPGFSGSGTVAGLGLASGAPSANLSNFSLSAFDYADESWHRLRAYVSSSGDLAGGDIEAVLNDPAPYLGPGGTLEVRLSALVPGLQVFGAVPTLSAVPSPAPLVP